MAQFCWHQTTGANRMRAVDLRNEGRHIPRAQQNHASAVSRSVAGAYGLANIFEVARALRRTSAEEHRAAAGLSSPYAVAPCADIHCVLEGSHPWPQRRHWRLVAADRHTYAP